MATGRALLTETEREYLQGEHGDQRMYEAKSRINRRIEEELSADVKLLEQEQPELFAALQEVVCDES
jgi:erythromycin esterase-like protein